MGLCRTANGKGKSRTQQLGLPCAYLFLRFENGIDKFLVRDLPVEMFLSHIIVNLELGVFKKLITDPCPDMERQLARLNLDTNVFPTVKYAFRTYHPCARECKIYVKHAELYRHIVKSTDF